VSLAASAIAVLLFANPPLEYYAPVPDFHDRMGRSIGVISSYVVGPSYTQAVIFGLDGSEYDFVVGGDFLMEGRILRCQEAPTVDRPVTSVLCPDWPSEIVLNETPVIFVYWRARAGDEQIAVLRRIDPLPGGPAGTMEPDTSGDPEVRARMPQRLWW
jgi:hypothetical protein